MSEDADKQNAINVFLGIFEPYLFDYHIWELEKDTYLHDQFIMQPWKLPRKYIEWVDEKVFDTLPFAYEQSKYQAFVVKRLNHFIIQF